MIFFFGKSLSTFFSAEKKKARQDIFLPGTVPLLPHLAHVPPLAAGDANPQLPVHMHVPADCAPARAKDEGFKVSLNALLHKPWHILSLCCHIIHDDAVKAITGNCIFYDAREVHSV